MKDTIPSNSVNNRKLILEVRFDPNPKIVDLRGKILDELMKAKIIPNALWELGNGMLSIADSLDQNVYTKKCFVDTQRFSFISHYNHTNESFFNSFNSAFAIINKYLEVDITRIGCRIQGTYGCKSNNYANILNGLLKMFPSQFLLEDFPGKDFNFQFVYQNGNYRIGPINEKDLWTKEQFPDDKTRNDKMGFAIDTDNFILKDKALDIIKITAAKDVYLTSLSVEKLLFEKLNLI